MARARAGGDEARPALFCVCVLPQHRAPALRGGIMALLHRGRRHVRFFFKRTLGSKKVRQQKIRTRALQNTRHTHDATHAHSYNTQNSSLGLNADHLLRLNRDTPPFYGRLHRLYAPEMQKKKRSQTPSRVHARENPSGA